MGGAGYNPSLSVGRAARAKASTRTPVHFYLDVPTYRIDLPCMVGDESAGHVFLSRTPLVGDGFQTIYCERCRVDRLVHTWTTPIEPDPDGDEWISLQQDEGILKERAATWLARNAHRAWTPEGEAYLMEEAAEMFGLSMTALRRVFVGIKQDEKGPSASLTMCRAGLHPLTPDNVDIVGKYRTCKACRRDKQRARRKKAVDA